MIYVLLCDYAKPHSGFYGLVAGVFDDLQFALEQCKTMNEIAQADSCHSTKPMYYWLVAMHRNTALGNVVKSSLSITTHVKHN